MGEGDDFYKGLLDNLYDGVYAVDLERRITYWSLGAERLTGFKASEVVGKRCQDNILVHVNDQGANLCQSGCPLLKVMEGGGTSENGVYLHHRQGHRVPVGVRCSPIHDASGQVAGAIEVFHDNSPLLEMEERMEELRRLTLLDPMTGAGNRRYAEMEIGNRLEALRRHAWSFGLAFMDLDKFKDINDRNGHDVGDRVLEMVARTAMKTLRAFDFFGRWGGEEFVAIMSHVEEEGMGTTAERIRSLIAQSSLDLPEGTLRVTVSIGVTLARPDDSLESLVKRADGLMYDSKAAGRNRTTTG